MTRIVPYPVFALALLAMWLLLNQSLSPGHILLGAAVSIVAVRTMATLRPERVRIRMSWAIPRLAAFVVYDLIRSNVAVGRIVLFGTARSTSAFISLPLDLRNPYGLAVLSCILAATPGTLWMQYDRVRSRTLVHVLDMVDEETWVALIKSRYERLLMDIFE